MQIKVIKTTTASKFPCGTKLFVYEAGNTYNIYQDLAEVFLKEGWGVKEQEEQEEEDEDLQQLIETQDLSQEIETQDLKLEKKPRRNAKNK